MKFDGQLITDNAEKKCCEERKYAFCQTSSDVLKRIESEGEANDCCRSNAPVAASDSAVEVAQHKGN
jgi:hypothetical protein